MADYIVKGPAVVLPLKGGSERYLYKGAPVGAGFTEEGIQHALSLGLIVKVETPEVETTKDAEKLPGGDPSAKWTVPQLEQFATEKSIDLSGASSKPDKLAAILAAVKPAD